MISNDPSGQCSTPGAGGTTRNFVPLQATRTVYFGNLDPRVDIELLYEIAIQAGPVKRISLPRSSRGYGFVVRQLMLLHARERSLRLTCPVFFCYNHVV
jgi:hypothetical protein